MRISSLLTLLLATCVFAAPSRGVRTCGSTLSEEDRVLLKAHMAKEPEQAEGTERSLVEGVPSIGEGNRVTNITVYWHVIQKSEDRSEGHVTASEMDAQIKVLNTAFWKTNVQFVLAGADYNTNADWFDHLGKNTSQNVVAKEALRKGDKATLNLYSTGFVQIKEGPGFLGYTSFPWSFAQKPLDDGAVFLWSSIPGGSMPDYNLGHTLTHEVGHWLGLIHTFEGGCDYPTVSRMGPETNRGCKKSCPGSGAVGPPTNYMDYDVDSCLGSFTPSQAQQIKKQLSLYRGINVAPFRSDQDRLDVKAAQTRFDLDHPLSVGHA